MARLLVRLGSLAAHDAAQADGAGIIGDAEHRRIHLHGLLIQEQHALPFAPPAHVDRAAQLVDVIDVQRPPELEHHIVGHVHKCRDRALPGALEALLHPGGRRRRGVDVANNAPGKAAAALRRADAHRMARLALCGHLLDARRFEGRAGQRGDLARHAEH